MDKVTFQDVSNPDGVVTTYAIIDKGNGEFTSMTKEYYDAQQANSGSSVAPVATPVDPVTP